MPLPSSKPRLPGAKRSGGSLGHDAVSQNSGLTILKGRARATGPNGKMRNLFCADKTPRLNAAARYIFIFCEKVTFVPSYEGTKAYLVRRYIFIFCVKVTKVRRYEGVPSSTFEGEGTKQGVLHFIRG